MADVSIDASILAVSARAPRSVAWHPTNADIGYWFYVDSDGTFGYSKTTDGGGTWGAQVEIASAAGHQAYSIWPDWWTPGDSGTKIHTWYTDTTNDDVIWRTLDISSDTLGTAVDVFVGVTAAGAYGCFISGTKTRSGYLYAFYCIDSAVEFGFKRSTDSGSTWSADLGGSFNEGGSDKCLLFPATGTGDNNDCWGVYLDASADSLTMKMWDSSAAAQVESNSFQTHVDNTSDTTGQFGFSASIRHSDGALIVVACSERDTATADMQCWEVTAVNSGSLTGITALANITTNIDDIYYPAVFIDQSTDVIYVAYNGKRDGSETLGTATKVYYTGSGTGGASWEAGDTAYMEGAAGGVVQVWTPLMGPRFYVGWRVGTTLLGNKVNSVTFVTVVEADGSSTGVGAATGIAAAVWDSVGSSSGTGAATGTAAKVLPGVVSAAGVGTAAAEGEDGAGNIVEADGTATGSGVATGVGTAVWDLVGSSAGAGTASASASATLVAVGSCAGLGAASGAAAAFVGVVASSSGVGSASASASLTFAVIASAVGLSTVTGDSESDGSVGVSGGTSAASADAAAIFNGLASAVGAGAASANAVVILSANGSAIGVGAASANIVVLLPGVASSSGVGTADAIASLTFASVGFAPGFATVLGESESDGSIGHAAGTCIVVGYSETLVRRYDWHPDIDTRRKTSFGGATDQEPSWADGDERPSFSSGEEREPSFLH